MTWCTIQSSIDIIPWNTIIDIYLCIGHLMILYVFISRWTLGHTYVLLQTAELKLTQITNYIRDNK